MQSHRIAGEADGSARRPVQRSSIAGVQGLGVSDALRIELDPCQVPWLVDEIDALRDVVDDAQAHQRARWEAVTETVRRARLPEAVEVEDELDRLRYEARVLEMVRDQLVRRPDREAPVAVFGPARIMAELVRGTARHVAATLGALLQTEPKADADARAELVRTAAVAGVWTETYVACEAVEWFSFDPDADPAGP